MTENEITEIIIGCAIKVHIPLIYEEVRLECGYRADLIANKKLLINIDSVVLCEKLSVLCG